MVTSIFYCLVAIVLNCQGLCKVSDDGNGAKLVEINEKHPIAKFIHFADNLLAVW